VVKDQLFVGGQYLTGYDTSTDTLKVNGTISTTGTITSGYTLTISKCGLLISDGGLSVSGPIQ
jgi:hypothetical protein